MTIKKRGLRKKIQIILCIITVISIFTPLTAKANLENSDVWQTSFEDVTLTGVWTDDLLAIAKTQVGYSESKDDYIVDNGGNIKGYTRYGDWYGNPYGDWDAMFVSFCLKYADVDEEVIPFEDNCQQWIDNLSPRGRYKDASYKPIPGDIIFFNNDENPDADHVGLVCEISEDGTIKTIEGDHDDSVAYCSYSVSNSSIVGYGLVSEDIMTQEVLSNDATALMGAQNDYQEDTVDPDIKTTKTIDYLGDGVTNPDTDLSGEDDYRLYLEASCSHQPVDLLIVADVTNSMENSYGTMSRADALDKIVNGTIISGSGSNAKRKSDGIIYSFLNMNEENQVAVMCFSGGYYNTGQSYESVYDSCTSVTRSWTSLYEMPNHGSTPKDCYSRVVRAGESIGTNYEIALIRAEEMLEEVKGDGHKKVMIFLTDGEPNLIINDGKIWRNSYQSSYIRSHTKENFVNFLESHPNLASYIIGISTDANTGDAYTLLSGIAQEGGCTYFPADTASQLQVALQKIIDDSKLSFEQIYDPLSDYVDYNSDRPDLKIVRKDKDGVITTVWQGNSPTSNNKDAGGNQIVTGVTYDPDTKAVKVLFNPDCYLDGNNTFTLSFNVRL